MLKSLPNAIKRVFKDKRFILSFFIISFAVYALAAVTYNHLFLSSIFSNQVFSLGEKISLGWGSITTFPEVIGIWQTLVLVVVSILAGLNLNLFYYYIKRRIKVQKHEGVGFLGILVGFVGIGCGACGSVLLTTLFGVTATSSVVGILPLNGVEFNIIGIAVLIFSSLYLSKHIEDPDVCPIK